MFADVRVGHARVGGDFRAGKSLLLPYPCGLDAVAERGGGLAKFFVAQLGNGERRGFDVDINAVEQGAADPRAIALNFTRRAPTFMARISEVAALTGVHRGYEHEGAGQGNLAGTTRDRHIAVFEGLAEDFERRPFELG